MRSLLALIGLLALLAGCASEPVTRRTEILVLGDSVMAWNGWSGRAVADGLEQRLGVPVSDRSRAGATILPGASRPIPEQYRTGDFGWVVFDGGANDLRRCCDCRACDEVVDLLISRDGSAGAIADLARRAAGDGARVMYLGAYRAPTGRLLFGGCDDELDEIDRRVMRLAAREPKIFFVSGKRALDPENARHFFIDRLHPSPEGSARLAALIAGAIERAGGV